METLPEWQAREKAILESFPTPDAVTNRWGWTTKTWKLPCNAELSVATSSIGRIGPTCEITPAGGRAYTVPPEIAKLFLDMREANGNAI